MAPSAAFSCNSCLSWFLQSFSCGLDLVISADTAVCHLAGALGVPVWLALAFAPDWRWTMHGQRTSAYPTMRLFRQPSPGNWPSVFQNMAKEIKPLLPPAGS